MNSSQFYSLFHRQVKVCLCSLLSMFHVSRIIFSITIICGGFALSNCGNDYSETIEIVRKPGYQQSHGPFDSNGKYIESWADKPPRRIFVNRRGESKSSKPSKPKTLPNPPTPQPNYAPQPQRLPQYTPPSSRPSNYSNRTSPPRTQSTIPPVASQRNPQTSAPRPQPQVIRPRAQAPISHRVTSSDTLYSLSRYYGVSISSIQRANGIRGTTIVTGSTILIPR